MNDLSSIPDDALMQLLQATQAATQVPAGPDVSKMSDAEILAGLGVQQGDEQQGPPLSMMSDERPWYQKLGSAADDIVRLGANAITLGMADRLAGALGGEGKEAERIKTEDARTRAGGAGLVTEIGGTLLPAGALMKGVSAAVPAIGAMTGKAGLAARTGSMAAQGAALGATEAAIGDRSVGQGAAIGAVAGGLGNLAGEAIAKGASGVAGLFNKKPSIPDAASIKNASREAYARSEAAGVIIRPEPLKSFAKGVQDDLAEFGYLPALQPKVGTVLQEIERISGNNTTLKGVDQMRKLASTLRTDQDASTRALGGKIIEKLDDMVDNLKLTDVLTGNKTEGVKALQEARSLHQMARKSEVIDEAVEKATNNAAAAGTGGNIDNAIRQQFRSILNNPKSRRGFTPDELDAMRQIVRGTNMQNVARLIGRLSPQGNGLMLLLHGTGGIATGGATIPLAAAGAGAKAVADRATPRNVEMLSEIIRSGGSASALQPPANAFQRLAASQSDNLGKLLMTGGLLAGRE